MNGTKPAGIHVDHWRQHPGCKKWGSFGYDRVADEQARLNAVTLAGCQGEPRSRSWHRAIPRIRPGTTTKLTLAGPMQDRSFSVNCMGKDRSAISWSYHSQCVA